MKKLYEVEAKWYVMAESQEEAESGCGINLDGCTIVAYLAKGVDADWRDAIPFGKEIEGRTCSRILKEATTEPASGRGTTESPPA